MGWGVFDDDADSVEADHDRQPAEAIEGWYRRTSCSQRTYRSTRRPVDPSRGQRVEVLGGALAAEYVQVVPSMYAGLSAVATQKGGYCGPHDELIGRDDIGHGGGRSSHIPPCATSDDDRQHARSGRSVRG